MAHGPGVLYRSCLKGRDLGLTRDGGRSLAGDGEPLARPEGSEHTPPTFVIEGVAALVAVLRAA
jgi:hypothetical protein